ncbi:helix-turn-helix domain-containing protein [Acidithiobacillus sp. HP-6]|uniref:helix-turn-helix domain-containing protein n=1 Tax=unclassified Acidithiobacillus TaxID=2614800 RepID=UPI00187A2859|nr:MULTISPECIES: helix-turn-helix domain-containing protein [unclassified Acidithiobacillus]MBE7562243.1 helix-turn-helix domain-containing protein [Acidithiobacillus sp. HP-6]MBE7568968.1 helix-turn-helix domain-containing protein [Acidithiobacillus sp. HP-2]
MQTETETVSQIIAEISRNLGYPPDAIPTQVDEKSASLVLDVKPATLCNWRCTGRYNLPYVKTGRLVRYRVADLAAWIAKRRTGAEG